MLDAMPRVQELLLAHGVTFHDAMVPTSLCCPSRASILTGNYAHTTGVYTNVPPYGGFPVFRDASTLATWLHGAGYRTGLFGKYLNRYREGYVPPGWSRWFGTGSTGYWNTPYTVKTGEVRRLEPDVYSPYFFAERTVGFIRGTAPSRPLFAYYAPFGVHAPALAAPEDLGSASGITPWRPPNYNEADQSDKPPFQQGSSVDPAATDALYERQHEALTSADRAIGWVLDALVETGRMQNTVVVLLSDNGVLMGEHGLRSKNFPYDQATRVLMAMRYSAGGWTGTRTSIVANIDIAPTIEAVTGLDFPSMDGRSLVPLIQNDTRVRSRLTLERGGGTSKRPSYCGIRSLAWMFARYADGSEELYDYRTDPYELTNLAHKPAYADTLKVLRMHTKEACRPVPPGFAWSRP
jgi:N-acetylglucosamine-6-sulfatase